MVSVPSDSTRIHSWLWVYLSSAGTFIASPMLSDKALAMAHERRLDHARREALVANLDFDLIARVDADREAREPDRLRKGRRDRAARHFAFACRGVDLLMAAQHAALVEKEDTDELPLRRHCDRRPADEIAR